ncbi:MAG: 5-(carboxyamino)imidazole ribonucleotide mutase [Candidatus Thermoplasmatota archaeon]|nr:5-(carboxyamino)imidazole ribonucleotide mutase [Candidatus Thermoplasmatota archaeon]MBS3790388.1 5-(carboxyamino)imidazole ribonucleotide mutase [Candidatus Thermoplasmatota archaeon]
MDVKIILGSKSDLEVGEKAVDILEKLDIDYEMTVSSAHRTPERTENLCKGAEVFITVAGLSAALPGVVASHTTKPVIGVPVSGRMNLDSLLSIVQMPPGVPVATVGMNRGDNAALLAVEILARTDDEIKERLEEYRENRRERVYQDAEEVEKKY